MTKVNVRDKNLKVIQLLMDEGYLSESYVKVTTDICVLQALAEMAKQDGKASYNSTGIADKLRREVY